MEPQPGAFALWVVVLDKHADHGRHSGKAVEHRGDERTIAQADDGVRGNRIEELARFFGGQYRRFALLDDVFWPTHGRRRVEGHDLPGHQPIKEHADGGQVLLHGGIGEPDGEALEVGGDMHGPDVVQREAALLTPVKKPRDGAKIGLPRVLSGRMLRPARWALESTDMMAPTRGPLFWVPKYIQFLVSPSATACSWFGLTMECGRHEDAAEWRCRKGGRVGVVASGRDRRGWVATPFNGGW